MIWGWQIQTLLLLACVFIIHVASSCGNKEDDSDISLEHEKAKYSKEVNEKWKPELRLVEQSISSYVECNRENCGCHKALIKSDLATFKESKITKSMVEDAMDLGVIYQIIDHKLYRQTDCMFEFRCRGVEHFILQLVDTLPDMEFVLNTRDWPMVNLHHGRRLPVFSFSKTPDYWDITYPAWTFWTGGPAISLYPTGLGRWDQHIVSISRAARATPWEERADRAFFRGSRTSAERDPLVLLSRRRPALVDAQYTKNQAWRSESDTLGAQPAAEVALEDHCRYKYLFNFRGVAASFRFKHLFLCGSLVFHVGDEWSEFFYPQLKPWVHYVPVRGNPTEAELERLILFAQENEGVAREIARRGQQFILDNLRMKDVSCYWRKLLVSYAKLLSYRTEKRPELMEVPWRD
ncbi:O-glucosyltransferase rumi homolog [Pollicipes pollicipes]|uniref:O-glucosyltransferase rumi homolog n=1 Tax=Pollicipes pollicipes TaxID=41117 RepID=UPI001884F551|nr:O-glucosyltransferase rumi homolog [Pollicipes pollicipes]XP_037090737.1 O-glucosyltransferase rumi homolog [Pollicipes pollicipes]XP_037090738.1 O-glucosyltransferase rumi homolog [Pollicipes pollicipes]XP_037090739.1 O-glucosyltransferase rumi homolog [Pollicipes pollicipes]XP_037090740.1 O-glucosyltransferase rumi homolog [Pollicipes pollicipes]